MNYLILLSLISTLFIIIVDSLFYLHILQLEGYKTNQYMHWLNNNYLRKYKRHIIFYIQSLLVFLLLSFFNIRIALFAVMIGIAIHLVLSYFIDKVNKEQQKKKMVYTSRLLRVIGVLAIILLLEIGILYYYLFSLSNIDSIYIIFTILLVLLLLYTPFNVFIANTITIPIEKIIQNRFKLSAKNILQKHTKLKTIGITGSYGKTSTKNYLYDILSVKFKVLKTPESFNTPMGLCKVIRGELKEEHDIFIAEMGARYVNDIKEICQFVKPDIGILTSVGPQHLETFKSIDNIANEKFELIKSLPIDGFAVLNGDNDISIKYANEVKVNKIFVGIENKDTEVFATDIEYNSSGTNFVINYNNEKISCTTKVLGLHSIYNILQAVCVAKYLGLTNDEIEKGISKIKPVEHRLQIIPTNNGITVIDDAFNSNPVGSKMALDVISKFTGNKIIITPGMIELGDKEYDYNKEFGVRIGEVCDYAILIGEKRSKPIVDGIMQTDFNKERIIVVKNLNEATIKVGQIAKAGDVLLFENDLPDNYNE